MKVEGGVSLCTASLFSLFYRQWWCRAGPRSLPSWHPSTCLPPPTHHSPTPPHLLIYLLLLLPPLPPSSSLIPSPCQLHPHLLPPSPPSLHHQPATPSSSSTLSSSPTYSFQLHPAGSLAAALLDVFILHRSEVRTAPSLRLAIIFVGFHGN